MSNNMLVHMNSITGNAHRMMKAVFLSRIEIIFSLRQKSLLTTADEHISKHIWCFRLFLHTHIFMQSMLLKLWVWWQSPISMFFVLTSMLYLLLNIDKMSKLIYVYTVYNQNWPNKTDLNHVSECRFANIHIYSPFRHDVSLLYFNIWINFIFRDLMLNIYTITVNQMFHFNGKKFFIAFLINMCLNNASFK